MSTIEESAGPTALNLCGQYCYLGARVSFVCTVLVRYYLYFLACQFLCFKQGNQHLSPGIGRFGGRIRRQRHLGARLCVHR